jgi:hypothetical protein
VNSFDTPLNFLAHLLHHLLHTGVGPHFGSALAFTLLDPTHDHRDAKLGQMAQNLLRFSIKLDGLALLSGK